MNFLSGGGDSGGGDGGGGDLLGELGEGCRMSRQTRMMGFAACFGLGFLMSFMSPLMLANPAGFATVYTIGNLLAIGSTTFLVGPARQLRYMFDRTRVIATLIYLACLGGTLWAGFARADLAIVLALLVAQFCALVWYTASYIPYARNAIQSCLCSCFK